MGLLVLSLLGYFKDNVNYGKIIAPQLSLNDYSLIIIIILSLALIIISNIAINIPTYLQMDNYKDKSGEVEPNF